MKNNKGKRMDSQEAEQAVEETFPTGFETVEVEFIESPYHKKGHREAVAKVHAERFIKKGWAKAIVIIAFLIAALNGSGYAQTGVDINFHNTTYTTIAIDSTVDTGTGSITSGRVGGGGTTTTVVLTATEISGTGAGTATLLGSLDGTNFVSIVTPNTVTAIPTHTITDTSGAKRYTWILSGSPYLYYRITHAGSGTMLYTIGARVMKH